MNRLLAALLLAWFVGVPADGGDLTAKVKKGTLEILGSDEDDVFDVVGLGPGVVVVRGLHGTTVNGKQKKTFDGVDRDVTIKTMAGDDDVAVFDLWVGDDLRVKVDGGHDRVLLDGVYVADDLLVLGENGRDDLTLHGVVVDGDASVKGGKKADDVWLFDCVFDGDFVLRAGKGDDDVDVEACLFTEDAEFDLGGGYDTIALVYGTSFWDDVEFDGGGDVDAILLGGVWFAWGTDVDVDDFEFLYS
ncbi:MAG: hypothetical protein ACF8XB_24940 [Planctomycetota bacterium JB042]